MKPPIASFAAVLFLAACTPTPPHYFTPEPQLVSGEANPAAINSVDFALRPAPPGRPGYLETISYINNGVKYVDPYSEFFVSFDGALCFRGMVNHQQVEFENYQNYWCMHPTAVENIEALENNISHVNEVRLWCRHAAPQCARRYGVPDLWDENSGIGNSISAQILPYKEERSAIEYLVYLMGGAACDATPLLR